MSTKTPLSRKELAELIYSKGIDALLTVDNPFRARGMLINALMRNPLDIVFVRVSERRYLVVSVDEGRDYQAAEGHPGYGYRSTRGEIIAGPCSREQALEAATRFAETHNGLIHIDNYHCEEEIRKRSTAT